MKIEIKQNILMHHLNYVIKGISNKNIIPVLNCIKIEVEEDGIYLTSTDNEIAIKSFINKNDIKTIDKLGSIVVSGKYIYEIIKKLPNNIISLEEVIDNKLYITTPTSEFNLNCNDVSEFPSIDLKLTKNPIYITKKDFKNIIKQTSFSTSLQESRPILTGINFKIKNNILECTSTDSYRLSKKTIELKEKIKNEINIVIPNKNLLEINKLLNDEEGNLELHIFNNKVIFNFNNIIIMTRLINGDYPDTSKLIPKEFSIKLSVNLNEYINSIDRASLLTSETDKNTIKLEVKNNLMIISSSIPEIGNVEEKLNINNISEKNIIISFSSKFMIEALKSFNCLDIEMLFNDEIHPIILKDKKNNELIQLVLPIRTY